jgi:hypothetical protein
VIILGASSEGCIRIAWCRSLFLQSFAEKWKKIKDYHNVCNEKCEKKKLNSRQEYIVLSFHVFCSMKKSETFMTRTPGVGEENNSWHLSARACVPACWHSEIYFHFATFFPKRRREILAKTLGSFHFSVSFLIVSPLFNSVHICPIFPNVRS